MTTETPRSSFDYNLGLHRKLDEEEEGEEVESMTDGSTTSSSHASTLISPDSSLLYPSFPSPLSDWKAMTLPPTGIPDAIKTTVVHYVEKGDTLIGIALKYGIEISELRKSNRLFDNHVHARKHLVIPSIRNSSSLDTVSSIDEDDTSSIAGIAGSNGDDLRDTEEEERLVLKLQRMTNAVDTDVLRRCLREADRDLGKARWAYEREEGRGKGRKGVVGVMERRY